MSVEQGVRDAIRALSCPSAYSINGNRVLTILHSKDQWRIARAIVDGVVRQLTTPAAVHLMCSNFTSKSDLIGYPTLTPTGELSWVDGAITRAYRTGSTIVLHDVHELGHIERMIVSSVVNGFGIVIEHDGSAVSNVECVVVMTAEKDLQRSALFHCNAIVVK